MFHVKHDFKEKLERYKEQVEIYHHTLDLMSDSGLAKLEEHIDDALRYADIIDTQMPTGVIVDVGSGVGLPGIVLASVLPERKVILVERRRRRCTFLSIVVSKLELNNAEIYKDDVRDIEAEVSVVSAQAVASLETIYCLTQHLHAEEILLVSRKNAVWQQEIKALGQITPVVPQDVYTQSLDTNGTLVAVRVQGGRA